MIFFRKILFPFAVLYGFITSFRNFLFDQGILKSVSFDVPVIVVGNLSVGGTGKTPQIEYLIRLLSEHYKIATLSRGYKRKSEGFILADENSNAEILGDEPFQFHKKFPFISVAVDANRVNGIMQLLSLERRPDIILLDDAFQHRKVRAGFYILLTAYNDLYCDDYMLPTGNLRESRKGVNRADVIIVTKCPAQLSKMQQQTLINRLRPNSNQPVFFSSIQYDEFLYSEVDKIPIAAINGLARLFVAGIAKPEPFFNHFHASNQEQYVFSDHHIFTHQDIAAILTKAGDGIIITTEKDFVRLKGKLPKEKLYYLPIQSTFLDGADDFNTLIYNYVGTSTGNG